MGGEVCKGKKEAEHSAAKAAMKVEFPEHFKKVNAASGKAAGGMAMWAAPGKGQKRNAAEMNPNPGNEPKQRMVQAAQLLKGAEPLAKGHVVYECAEDAGKFVATVTLQAYDPST